MTDLTKEKRKELRELAAKATDRPWVKSNFGCVGFVSNDNFYNIGDICDVSEDARSGHGYGLAVNPEDDILFIVATANAIIPLLNELEGVELRIAELEKEYGQAREHFENGLDLAELRIAELEARGLDGDCSWHCTECGSDAPYHASTCRFYKPENE